MYVSVRRHRSLRDVGGTHAQREETPFLRAAAAAAARVSLSTDVYHDGADVVHRQTAVLPAFRARILFTGTPRVCIALDCKRSKPEPFTTCFILYGDELLLWREAPSKQT